MSNKKNDILFSIGSIHANDAATSRRRSRKPKNQTTKPNPLMSSRVAPLTAPIPAEAQAQTQAQGGGKDILQNLLNIRTNMRKRIERCATIFRNHRAIDTPSGSSSIVSAPTKHTQIEYQAQHQFTDSVRRTITDQSASFRSSGPPYLRKLAAHKAVDQGRAHAEGHIQLVASGCDNDDDDDDDDDAEVRIIMASDIGEKRKRCSPENESGQGHSHDQNHHNEDSSSQRKKSKTTHTKKN